MQWTSDPCNVMIGELTQESGKSIMLTLLAAASVPLVSITVDDPRLDNDRTFISAKAKVVLEQQAPGEVLCLDSARSRYDSICLIREEWVSAVSLANAGKGKEPPKFVDRIQHVQH